MIVVIIDCAGPTRPRALATMSEIRSAVAAQHQETRFQFDIAIVQDFDLERHSVPPCLYSCLLPLRP